MSDKSHLPMLAKPVDWNKVVYPCTVQPKLDGIRCLAFVENGHVRLQSRDGKPLYMDNIRRAVESLNLPHGTILDGELYAHGVDFNKLSGDVRRMEQDSRKDYIQYWVYDVMGNTDGIQNCSYDDRYGWLQDRVFCSIEDESETICEVPTFDVHDFGEIQRIAEDFEKQGYEGSMIRTKGYVKPTKANPNPEPIEDYYQAAYYGHSRRSDFLVKVKTFEDAEAVIVGVEEEIDLAGNPKGRTGKFVMKTADGIEFRASGITDAIKEDSWANPTKYIGQTGTYKFFGVSADGVPRHPNFKALRPAGQADSAV